LTQNHVPEDIDLEVEFSNSPLYPELSTQLSTLQSAVERADKLGEEVLKVRIEFMKALQDLEEPINSARNDMSAVSQGSSEVSGRGIDDSDLKEKLGAAYRLNTKLEGLQVQAKDPDGFRATATELIAAVAAAQAALESAREELKRREAELRERKQCEETLEEISGEVNQAEETVLKKMEKMIGGGDDAPEIPDIQSLIARSTDLRSQCYTMEVEELKSKVSALREQSQADVQKLKDMHKDADEKNKKRFADLKARFNNRASVAPPPLPGGYPAPKTA